MIIFDTSVVSELLRLEPERRVKQWAASFTSGPCSRRSRGKLRFGVLRSPAGRRRDELAAGLARVLVDAEGHILDSDSAAAERAANVRFVRESSGRPMSTADAMIAEICLANGAALATRNGRDFEGTGVPVVDPWDS